MLMLPKLINTVVVRVAQSHVFKIPFLDSHLDFILTNLGTVSNK
jgi:hypothetical protein